MASISGRKLKLSLPRRWINDLMHICRGMPVASVERDFDLTEVASARGAVASPPSWTSLLVKAYALTAQQLPPLRQSYQSWPWPHLYEVDSSRASVAVARMYDGEDAVFFGLLQAPETQTLTQIHQHLADFKTKPVAEISSFRRMVRISKFPGFVRRCLWWYGYHISGRMRAKTFGTFGVSVLGASGVTLLDLVFPLTTAITVGPVRADGRMQARLFFDHRVLDGALAAKALQLWEEMLQGPIVQELTAQRECSK